MEKREYRHNAYAMIYLTSCAVNGKAPDREKIAHLDLEQLFEVCQKHILTACVAYALEAAGIRDHNFTQAKEKAIRKNILLDAERAKILKRLEAEKIWYMPLKGSLLKDWYPKLGMRQMSDNDILCDNSKMAEVRDIFLDMGYACEHFGQGNHDVYFKEPVLNFEMHRHLFAPYPFGNLYIYYENVRERLIRNAGSEYGYHFKYEDFYLYILSHEYKHFSSGGTGVRSLVDTYVFLRKFSDSMDWDYINTELKKLGIADYEKQNRELAMKVMQRKKLTPEEKKQLDYYIFSGTYGTVQNRVGNNLKRFDQGSKLRYIIRRIVPPMHAVKAWYPFFYAHPWLMPVLWIYRPFRGLIVNRKRLRAELVGLMKSRKG